MHAYVRSIRTLFVEHKHPGQAGPMKAYMRGQFEYLGIKSPELKELIRQHIRDHGLPPLADLDRILRDLWELPEREYQYAATSLLEKSERLLPSEFISTLEYLLVTKSWWDTVDTIATETVGSHFKRFPKVRSKYLPKWRRSSNFWLRRAAILFQLDYKADTDFDLLREIIRENLGTMEFFINKAIGWSLRQYSRVDPQGVRLFVKETDLNPLSAREALKWLEKRKM